MDKDELKFEIVDKDGKPAPNEVFEKYLRDLNFRKPYRSTLSLINHKIIRSNEVGNWKFYFGTDESFNVLGDNPIILENDQIKHIEDTNFIIPLTSKNMLVHKKGERIDRLESETMFKISLMVFLQSKKYASCRNREFLSFLANMGKMYNESRIKTLKEEVFSLI